METLNLHLYVKGNPRYPGNHVGLRCGKGMPFGEQKISLKIMGQSHSGRTGVSSRGIALQTLLLHQRC